MIASEKGRIQQREEEEEEVQIGLLTVDSAKGGRERVLESKVLLSFSTRLKIDVSAAVSKERRRRRKTPLDPLLLCPFNAGYLFFCSFFAGK